MQSELKPCAHETQCAKHTDTSRSDHPVKRMLDFATNRVETQAAEITRLTEALRVAEERERDAVMSAYCAGATDVHNSWVEGTNGGEADFGESASDYYSSIKGN